MNTYEFGKFLAQLRKEKGLTQIQLAEKLNVTDKAVSRWETGKNYPDIEIFEGLSNILDVSISELLEGKRIEKEKLFTVSEENIVKQIKKNKKSKRKYLIAISVIIIFSIICGYFALRESGYFAGVIYNKIPCYSNDVLTIMNNIDGYISQRPKAEGEFIINSVFFFMEHDKTTTDIFYLTGTCENGRAFYINTMYDEVNRDNSHCFIGEYRKNQKCAKGISFNDLKCIVSQLDTALLPHYEKYQLDIGSIINYDNHNLNPNDFQKNIMKFVFSNGVLKKYDNSFLSGDFLLIQVSGFNGGHGTSIAYIFCER